MKFSIVNIFRQNNWSDTLIDNIGHMLELAAEMFAYDVGIIVYGEKNDDPQNEIYERDKEINRLQREIRRRIVSRLAAHINPGDVPSGLIFMNVVKDIERIGDYMKNLYEVRSLMCDVPEQKLYQDYLVGRSRTIEDILEVTAQAFTESDGAKANEVIDRARSLGVQAEKAIREVTLGDMEICDAVCLVLILRFYKRIAAHLSNVCTTVVMPVDLLDFYDEPGGKLKPPAGPAGEQDNGD